MNRNTLKTVARRLVPYLISFGVVSVCFVFTLAVAHAADAPGSISFSLPNPLKAKNLQCLLYDIINGIIAILGIVAAIYIIYSGFLFVAAQGNEEKLKAAKRAFFNALIGTVILLGAWAITSFVVNVINEVTARPVAGLPSASSCSN